MAVAEGDHQVRIERIHAQDIEKDEEVVAGAVVLGQVQVGRAHGGHRPGQSPTGAARLRRQVGQGQGGGLGTGVDPLDAGVATEPGPLTPGEGAGASLDLDQRLG